MNKHSLGACAGVAKLEPLAIIEAHIDLVLHGLEPRSNQRTDPKGPSVAAPARRRR